MAVFHILLAVLLLMPSILLGAEHPAIRKLSLLLSPHSISEMNEVEIQARLYVLVAHLEQTRLAEGFHAEEQIQRAIALKQFSPQRAAVTRNALLDAWRAASTWQLFTGDELAKLAAGKAATIQFGQFKNQLCHAAYIVAPETSPHLKHELANLRLTTDGEVADVEKTRRIQEALIAMETTEKDRRKEVNQVSEERAVKAETAWDAAIVASGGQTGATLSIQTQGLESTSRENRQRVKLSIRATNATLLPVAAEGEWFFIGRSPKKGAKFLVGQGTKELRLPPSSAEAWEVYSESFTSDDTKRTALILDGEKVPRKAAALRKIDEIPLYGWIVRALVGGKVIGLKTSTPELEAVARDEAALNEMREASARDR